MSIKQKIKLSLLLPLQAKNFINRTEVKQIDIRFKRTSACLKEAKKMETASIVH